VPGPSLEDLEGERWGEPPYDSYLVRTCHRLRRKPVDELTNEDLRFLIGQGIGLPHLLDRAVALLEINPLVEGDYYPGDLLAAVLRFGESFLAERSELFRRVAVVAGRAEALLRAESESSGATAELLGEVQRFLTTSRRPPQSTE
jgi:CDI immunity proteins